MFEVQKEDVEDLLPKGASELTKQQIRYLLQVRSRPQTHPANHIKLRLFTLLYCGRPPEIDRG